MDPSDEYMRQWIRHELNKLEMAVLRKWGRPGYRQLVDAARYYVWQKESESNEQ